jgi:hypothetical protein
MASVVLGIATLGCQLSDPEQETAKGLRLFPSQPSTWTASTSTNYETPCGLLEVAESTRFWHHISEQDRKCKLKVIEGKAVLNGKALVPDEEVAAPFREERWSAAYRKAYENHKKNEEAEKAMGDPGEGEAMVVEFAERPAKRTLPCGELFFDAKTRVAWVDNQEKKVCRVRVFEGTARIAGEVMRAGEEVVVPYSK